MPYVHKLLSRIPHDLSFEVLIDRLLLLCGVCLVVVWCLPCCCVVFALLLCGVCLVVLWCLPCCVAFALLLCEFFCCFVVFFVVVWCCCYLVYLFVVVTVLV